MVDGDLRIILQVQMSFNYFAFFLPVLSSRFLAHHKTLKKGPYPLIDKGGDDDEEDEGAGELKSVWELVHKSLNR